MSKSVVFAREALAEENALMMIDETSICEAHFGEADPEAVDKEWEEFAKLVETKKQRQEQAFYPCPAEEDYVSTLVRKSRKRRAVAGLAGGWRRVLVDCEVEVFF